MTNHDGSYVSDAERHYQECYPLDAPCREDDWNRLSAILTITGESPQGWSSLSKTGRIAVRKWYRFYRNQHHKAGFTRAIVEAMIWGVVGATELRWTEQERDPRK